ncbi:UDP-glycosyltransferase UGT5-like [Zophobas morio]|uniref:UDP-glycosyltransferase UGT5-like n=1 Tax=Zophobas morio TaxID=2755281 RepID=UPI003083824B
MLWFNVLLFFGTGISACVSYKILSLTHIPTRSHHILASRLVEELSKKGHEVTFVTIYPSETPLQNVTEISLEGLQDFLPGEDMFKQEDTTSWEKAMFVTHRRYKFCEHLLSLEKIQNLMKSQQHFDAVILYYYLNDAMLALAHYFKAPVILFASMPLYASENFLLSFPTQSAYVPNIVTEHTGHMDFWQRLKNTFYDHAMALYYQHFMLPKHAKLVDTYIPGKPDLYKMLNNESLVLINSHVSTTEPIPHVPNAIEIGGFHIDEPKPLPKDLKQYLDDSVNGVILFSMGSIVRSAHFPEEKRKALLGSFSKLKLNVLWKFEENLTGLPPNVKIMKWIPVSDVLAHPNVKVFITHGGLLSTMEGVYHAVPLVGIPVFGDQKMNMALARSYEYAVEVRYTDLTEETLSRAIDQALNNPKYKRNIEKRSKIMRDRTLKPADNALYWIEYVIRHQGAPHLRYPGADLNWFQRNLLDVVGFVLVVTLLPLVAATLVIKRIVKKKIKSKTE